MYYKLNYIYIYTHCTWHHCLCVIVVCAKLSSLFYALLVVFVFRYVCCVLGGSCNGSLIAPISIGATHRETLPPEIRFNNFNKLNCCE